MRTCSILTALAFTFLLAGCGAGGTDVASVDAASVDAGDAVLQLAFGGEDPGITGSTTDTTLVCIQNYTHASILDAGIRPFGSTSAYQGSLTGHDPATFGQAANGGAAWVTLGAGTYEGFLDTDLGRFEFVGSVHLAQLPDGTVTVAPTCLYLFAFDLVPDTGGGTPTPGGGGGGTPTPGAGGGTFIPGGGGVGP